MAVLTKSEITALAQKLKSKQIPAIGNLSTPKAQVDFFKKYASDLKSLYSVVGDLLETVIDTSYDELAHDGVYGTSGQVAMVSQAEAEAGTVTSERRFTPQRISQAISALGGGGGGTTVTFFQVQDDATTGQATTNAPVDIAGIWATPTVTDADFSWNGTTGELTVNQAGTIELDIQVTSWNNANNRHELKISLLQDTGGGYNTLVGSTNYASRNNTQDEGSTWINGFKVACSSGDKFKVQVWDVGVSATVGGTNIGGQTYISAKIYS